MCNLRFEGIIGDKTLLVSVFRPQGGGWILIMVNHRLQGSIEKVNGIWLVDLPRNSWLTSDDLMVLIDMMEE